MKKLKAITLICLAILTFSCNKDDDSSETQEATNLELLTSGKWYQESKTPGTTTSCEKKTNLLFKTDGTLKLEIFEETSGSCQSLGIETLTYTLTNNVDLTLTFGTDTLNLVILSITETQLNIRNDQDDEILVFDKTEG